jgi:putative flippase GtrA
LAHNTPALQPLDNAMVRPPKATLLMLANFGVVGVAATVTYFLLAVVLQATLLPNPICASVLAYCAAAALSYFGHQLLTFRSDQSHRVGLPRFVLTTGVGLTLVWAIPKVFRDYWHFTPIASYLFICFAIPILNFIVLRFWVFSKRNSSARG